MRRLILRLAIAFLTFTIGIAAATLWSIYLSKPSKIVKVEKVQPTVSPIKQERTYKPAGVAGSCITDAGYGCSFTGFESSDGMTFSQMSEFYDSPKRANRKLEKKLKKATDIIKREPVYDEQGKKVGEKVIATFPPNDPYNGVAELLWTYESRFTYVSGTSLQNILEYEKDRFR